MSNPRGVSKREKSVVKFLSGILLASKCREATDWNSPGSADQPLSAKVQTLRCKVAISSVLVTENALWLTEFLDVIINEEDREGTGVLGDVAQLAELS